MTIDLKQLLNFLDNSKRLVRIAPVVAALALGACSVDTGAFNTGALFPTQSTAAPAQPQAQAPSTIRQPLPTPLLPQTLQPQAATGGITFQPQFLPPQQPAAAPAPMVQGSAPQFAQTAPQQALGVPSISAGTIGFQSVPTVAAQPMAGQPPSDNRVAMLLPLSGSGSLTSAARSMRNAALLAQGEIGGGLQLSFHDTRGTASGAAAAAREALSEGAGLILGPLLGGSIDAVASIANPAGVNVVAYSNDRSRGRPGAYLLGISPNGAIDRVLSYAAGQGKRSIAVAVPDNALGSAALSAAQSAAARYGQTIVRTERYSATTGSDGKSDPAKALADDPNIDALLIADNASRSREFAALLTFHQFNFGRKQVLGTERWADGAVSGEAGLRQAWYAAPASGKSDSFRANYRSRFGGEPPQVAALAYDAVGLANDLRRTGGFQTSNITKPSGFLGASGNFRLSSSGQSERQYEVRSVSGQLLAPAASFSGLAF